MATVIAAKQSIRVGVPDQVQGDARATPFSLGFMRLAIAGFLLLFSRGLFAQDCTCNAVTSSPGEWTRGMYQSSVYVFYGTVTSVAPPMPDSNEVHDQPTFAVHESFKGDFKGGEVRGADCGSGMLPGESAIIFLDGYHRMKSCSVRVSGLTEQKIREAVLELSSEESAWTTHQPGAMDGERRTAPNKLR